MDFSTVRTEAEEVLNQGMKMFKETVQKAESDLEKVMWKFIAQEKKKGAARLKAAMEVVVEVTKDFKDAVRKFDSDVQKAAQVFKQAIEQAAKMAAAADAKEALDATAKQEEESSEGGNLESLDMEKSSDQE
jgi:gas vesicle protein